MSSFYSDASLVMIPSGYKAGKVYSAVPTDGLGDLVFTRSLDTATRVGPDGLIEKVRTNLALQSEAFNTTWGVNGIVVTANTAANPLTGTTTADTITANAANNFHIINQSITYAANENTVSVYVKANGYTWFLIDPSITNAFGYFNITTGAVGTKGSACTTSITNVGGGWYRCSVTFTATAGAAICNFSIRNADNGGAFLGDGVSGFFIFGAQVETGVATPYIATTTAAVSVGMLANVPRLDYLNSSCPRLLLEPQRTNLATYSEQFNNSAWTKYVGATVTANTVTSPDGYTNADTLNTASGQEIYATMGSKAASAITYTFSCFAKYNSAAVFQISASDFATSATYGNFNLQTGVATFSQGATWSGTSVKMENYGNGWYRCIMTSTSPTTTGLYVSLLTSTSGSAYIYGMQCEQASYATSYIPTLGAAVTRSADAASKTGISALIGQTQGTVFVELADLTNYFGYIGVDDTANNNRVIIFGIGDSRAFVQVRVGGTILFTTSTPVISGSVKLALAYSSAGSVFYANGVQIGTNATSVTYSTLSQFTLNQASQIGSIVNQALLFKTRLTNQELQDLTTL